MAYIFYGQDSLVEENTRYDEIGIFLPDSLFLKNLERHVKKAEAIIYEKNNYMDIMEKKHMEIPWHDYTENDSNVLINKAGLIEKASVIGRVGLIMLSCGTGAWRVRTS